MHQHICKTLLATLLSLLASHGGAVKLVVHIDGLSDDVGTVSCGLYIDEVGFPDDDTGALTQSQPALPDATVCRFADIPAGRAAVAVSHDRNGNGRLDKNFLGFPREPWGVSNGVRPTLRPPRHAEAAFDVPAEGVLEIRLEVAQ